MTIEPGKGSAAHRHPGPVFAYILEGEYEWGIKDQPVKRLKAGDTFYEPAMCLHRVSRNPGKSEDAAPGGHAAPQGREGAGHPGAAGR